jgi:hypothetical protein
MEGMKGVQGGSGVGRLEWCSSTYQRTSPSISSQVSPSPRFALALVANEIRSAWMSSKSSPFWAPKPGGIGKGMSGEDMRARTRN